MSESESGSKVKKSVLVSQLEEITSTMDVPVFRRIDVYWLSKNLGVRNEKHPRYQEAMEILTTLSKMGVR